MARQPTDPAHQTKLSSRRSSVSGLILLVTCLILRDFQGAQSIKSPTELYECGPPSIHLHDIRPLSGRRLPTHGLIHAGESSKVERNVQ
ncbi:Zinc finger protein [Trichinella spiralis]|uniref:Zinc finger protein n=1 Tax=Trichinella spiralis TaxID=6334 RepID=A0ABR3KLA3_TRISP